MSELIASLLILVFWFAVASWLGYSLMAVAGTTGNSEPRKPKQANPYLTHIPGSMYADDARLQHWFDSYRAEGEEDELTQ